MKRGGTLADPRDEFFQPRVTAQRINRVIGPRKFGFRQGRVDLVMANLVQQNRLTPFAPAQFGDQVVLALFRLGRDRALAQGANRIVHRGEYGAIGDGGK